ncbi:hypothetical protein SAMN04488523_11563 [Sulfitobacter brevis]|uniref:Uncharacterized protein n=1 Tax=Sulfitobacter brevis TaxID=74348 RepID=A0A1I2FC88_9RHOB|nr:hypothetical protein [Sulfitobacter brevis]SFF03084.1 hypothetical protein SAMN04488523_11563 [Sulfitobacter brevis]
MRTLRIVILALFPLAWPAMAEQRDPSLLACETQATQNWIAEAFAGSEVLNGAMEGRVEVKAPAVIRDATLERARIGFSLRHGPEGTERRVAFVNVAVTDMQSHDRYGAAITTHRKDPGLSVFLSDVALHPGWPIWESYETTNYDAITLDAAEALYAQAVTIIDWNADAAIDSKGQTTQLVDVAISGNGNRPLRLWRPGPHYLVHSSIEKPGGGTLIWLKDCDRTRLRIFASRFNGADRLSADQVSCDQGTFPHIEYLPNDPRQTGDMHPVFEVCPKSVD